MAYLDNFDAECDCGNGISYREMGDGATCCEWCEYPSMDWVMWRKAVGADWLEQMETHGMDDRYVIDGISVYANDEDIAKYIVEQYKLQEATNV
jgi:hypothetical protein